MTVKIGVINWRPKYVLLFLPYSLKDGGGGSKRTEVRLSLGFCNILVEGKDSFCESASQSLS